MGLECACVQSQVFMMELITSLSRGGNLVNQEEEKGRNSRVVSLTNILPQDVVVDITKSARKTQSNKNLSKKDRVTCTHFKISSHTINKCCKLHGYPPRYKNCSRNAIVNCIMVKGIWVFRSCFSKLTLSL